MAMNSERAHSKIVGYLFQDELLIHDSIIFYKVRISKEYLGLLLGVNGLIPARLIALDDT